MLGNRDSTHVCCLIAASNPDDRQVLLAVTLLAIAVAIVVYALAVRSYSLWRDRDTDSCWVLAMAPNFREGHWESVFDYAVCGDRMCSPSYFRLLWPRKIAAALEDGLIYDTGIQWTGDVEIAGAMNQAKRLRKRIRVLAIFPPIRRRIKSTFDRFLEVASFAQNNDLTLLLVFQEDCDGPSKQIEKPC